MEGTVGIYPRIHLNGTSPNELLRQLLDAKDAVRKAMRALDEAAPNGRDYYPISRDAIKLAQAEHESRWNRLLSVSEELDQLAVYISDHISEGGEDAHAPVFNKNQMAQSVLAG
jgi:hypothetical protein